LDFQSEAQDSARAAGVKEEMKHRGSESSYKAQQTVMGFPMMPLSYRSIGSHREEQGFNDSLGMVLEMFCNL